MTQDTITLTQGGKGFELPRESDNWVLLREEGYSPVQLLVSAAGACGGYVYQSILKNSQIDASFHRVELNYQRDETNKGKPIAWIEIHYYLSVEEEHQDRTRKAAKLIHPNCPVIQSLSQDVIVKDVIHFV